MTRISLLCLALSLALLIGCGSADEGSQDSGNTNTEQPTNNDAEQPDTGSDTDNIEQGDDGAGDDAGDDEATGEQHDQEQDAGEETSDSNAGDDQDQGQHTDEEASDSDASDDQDQEQNTEEEASDSDAGEDHDTQEEQESGSDSEPEPEPEPEPETDPQPGNDNQASQCDGPLSNAVAGESYPLPNLSNGGYNHHHAEMDHEHLVALSLVDYADATHATLSSGHWCDPDIWHNRTVPGEDARVVIAQHHQVDYSHQNNVRHKTVRVDGTLRFSTSQSSRIIVDTLLVDPRGSLIIGTPNNPVSGDTQVEILFADYGNIDVDADPLMLGRGLIAHGHTRIHGAEKTTHLKVADDPLAGDSIITLAQAPTNWRVGDVLVIAGTRYSGWKWDNDLLAVRYHGTQDEVRTITAIQNNQVTLNEPLEFDHSSPRHDLKTSVANFTRNVVFANQNENVPTHQRGHVMFMHYPDIDVRYSEYRQLGRTDKSSENFEAIDLGQMTPQSNVRGRYSFHFHRTGISDRRNPAIALGNAVFGAPGWGFVHHDSNAIFHDNASFDTFGAGFVAETGNEIGVWSNNIAIKAEGNNTFNPKNGNDIHAFDIARSGDAYWFQGRMVKAVNNIAASVNRGYTYFHRDQSGTTISFAADAFMLPDALLLGRANSSNRPPIRNFDGNEAFASTVGMFVVKANPIQGHDVHSVMSNFTAWEVRAGAALEYTAHYLLKDFDLVAKTPEPFSHPLYGIDFGPNTSDMIVRNARIADFPDGICLAKDHTDSSHMGRDQFVVIGGEYTGVDTPLCGDYDPSDDLVIDDSDLVAGHFEVTLNENDSEGLFEYNSTDTSAGSGVSYTGTKTDSIGASPLPASVDEMETNSLQMRAILDQQGYYLDQDGNPYAIVKKYFGERATGEVHKKGLVTRLSPSVYTAMQSPYSSWHTENYQGIIDLNSQAPEANDDTVSTSRETEVTIPVLDNDSHPDGYPLSVSGVVEPDNGQVFLNSNSTITYRPNFGFTGSDSFHYWATDGHGNFSRARVNVTVH